MSNLLYTIHVVDADGQPCSFGPGDEVPVWARELIQNPSVWDVVPEVVKPAALSPVPEISDSEPVKPAKRAPRKAAVKAAE